jgi:hypothetical protein
LTVATALPVSSQSRGELSGGKYHTTTKDFWNGILCINPNLSRLPFTY